MIPNPARRRLEHALTIVRSVEHDALRRLSHMEADDPPRPTWLEQDVTRSRAHPGSRRELLHHRVQLGRLVRADLARPVQPENDVVGEIVRGCEWRSRSIGGPPWLRDDRKHAEDG